MAGKEAKVDFDFDEWSSQAGFCEDTITKLKKANITHSRALACLREADLQELKLVPGDRGVLREELKLYSVVVRSSPSTQSSVSSILSETDSEEEREILERRAKSEEKKKSASVRHTTSSLAKEPALADLVQSLDQGVKDLLTFQTCATDPSEGEAKGKFPYLAIPDHIRYDQDKDFETHEEVLSGDKGFKLLLRGPKRKLTPRQVSLPQWISANQTIFNKLLPSFSIKELQEYSDYVVKIGDLFHKYPTGNVMVLDDNHRRNVAQKGHKWNEIDIHLQLHGLHSQFNPKSSQPYKSNGNPNSNVVCRLFNTLQGCRFKNCKFAHSCSTCASASHAAFQHNHQKDQASSGGNALQGTNVSANFRAKNESNSNV